MSEAIRPIVGKRCQPTLEAFNKALRCRPKIITLDGPLPEGDTQLLDAIIAAAAQDIRIRLTLSTAE